MIRIIEKIHITSGFKKSYRKLSISTKLLATTKDKYFRKNAFDKRLNTHKLKGELKGYWSYSINNKYRVLFRFVYTNEVIYFDVGTHGIYK